MLWADILELDYLYYHQNISVPSVICNVVLPYPETGSILEIFYESVLDSLKMTTGRSSCFIHTLLTSES